MTHPNAPCPEMDLCPELESFLLRRRYQIAINQDILFRQMEEAVLRCLYPQFPPQKTIG